MMINFIGDILSYARCDNCGNTAWAHNHGGYWFYPENANPIYYCNRCPKPIGDGRLYRYNLPANYKAALFEVNRAGEKGSIFRKERYEL